MKCMRKLIVYDLYLFPYFFTSNLSSSPIETW